MITLSEREHLVAEQYCKGLADKEVADSLQRSEWTIKAQKRDIYKKLGISKDTELVLYMFCERMKINFDLYVQTVCDCFQEEYRYRFESCITHTQREGAVHPLNVAMLETSRQ